MNVVLPKTNLLSEFRSSTTSPYYESHLSQDPTLTQLWKLLKYPKFRLKYLQWRSMLKKTEHTVLKVGPRTKIICKKIFGHSLNFYTGQLQTLHPPQGILLNFFHYNAQIWSLWHNNRNTKNFNKTCFCSSNKGIIHLLETCTPHCIMVQKPLSERPRYIEINIHCMFLWYFALRNFAL